MPDTPDPLAGLRRGTCRGCGAPVVWCETAYRQLIPIDPEPSPRGNVILEGGVAHVWSGTLFDPPAPPDAPRFLSHYSTCTNPEDRRGEKKR